MRIHLTTEDGELIESYDLPIHVAAGDIEMILAAGLSHKYELDRCDECGKFTARDSMTEREDGIDAPVVVCPRCAEEA